MNKYSKVIVAAIGLVAVIVGPILLGEQPSNELVMQALTALVATFGVYQVTNKS